MTTKTTKITKIASAQTYEHDTVIEYDPQYEVRITFKTIDQIGYDYHALTGWFANVCCRKGCACGDIQGAYVVYANHPIYGLKPFIIPLCKTHNQSRSGELFKLEKNTKLTCVDRIEINNRLKQKLARRREENARKKRRRHAQHDQLH